MPVPILFCKISGPSFSYPIKLNVNNISLIVQYFFSKNTDLIKYFPVLLETKKHSYLYQWKVEQSLISIDLVFKTSVSTKIIVIAYV